MIDINKKYRTRDGREARIYATDGCGSASVHAAIKTRSGHWQQGSWWSNGQLLTSSQSDTDLVEVKPRIQQTVWINLYKNGYPAISYSNKLDADAEASSDRIGCVKVEIDVEEGHGL
jgi:elongation factor P hydroxylase